MLRVFIGRGQLLGVILCSTISMCTRGDLVLGTLCWENCIESGVLIELYVGGN